jgi:hypothetical protein
MKTKTQREWTEILKHYKASGMNARKFAAEQAINYHTLRYHQKKERGATPVNQTNPEKRIVPIPISAGTVTASPTGTEIKITVESGSVTIRIGGL